MSDRIIDVVFARSATQRKPNLVMLAVLIATLLHASVILWALRTEKSLESWSAEMALLVHDELQDEDVVTLEDEKPEPPKTQEAPPQKAAVSEEVAAAPAQAAAPAAAAAVITADAGPVDLSDNTFVSGTAALPTGGATANSGVTKPAIVLEEVIDDRSTKVTLEGDDWSCAWPTSAEGDLVNEQDVVIRVEVDADGKVLNAALVRDAKGGFGEAALACARRTHFVPAKDAKGKPVRAVSPPIQVHFSR